MDLKSLIAKMDQIESKKILMESAPIQKQKIVQQTTERPLSISQMLIKEFGYQLDEAPVVSGSGQPVMTRSDNQIWWENNFPGTPFPGEQAAQQAYDKMQSQGGQNPFAGLKNLFGGNKKPAQGSAAQPAQATPAAQTSGAPGAQDDVTGVDAAVAAQAASQPTATTQPVRPPPAIQSTNIAPAAPAAPTGALPPGKNEYGDDYQPVGSGPLQLPPGAEPEPGMSVAGGDAAKPPAGSAAQPAAQTPAPAKTPYKGSAGAQEIQKLNPAIKDVNRIQAGQQLKMPDGSTYTVKPGDTLDAIAKKAPAASAPKKELSQADKDAIRQQAQGAGGGRGSQGGPTAQQAAQAPAPAASKPATGAAAQPSSGAVNMTPGTPGFDFKKASQAANAQAGSAPATKAPGTTTTTTNQSVSGTIKMGKPEGPITFNGKTVNPGDPQYGAASQALLAQQQRAQQARSNMGAPKGAPSTAPVQQGATLGNRDFEENISRIRQLAGI